MELSWSPELVVILDESQDIAKQLDQPVTTAHLLLCLFILKNRAALFLETHGVTVHSLLERIRSKPRERSETWTRTLRRAEDTCRARRSDQVTSLHLLFALCSFVDSAAYKLLRKHGVDVVELREELTAMITASRERVSVASTGSATSTTQQRALGSKTQTTFLPASATPSSAETSEARSNSRREHLTPVTPEARLQRAVEVHSQRLQKLKGRSPVENKQLRPRQAGTEQAPPKQQHSKSIPSSPPRRQRHHFALRSGQYPLLSKLGRNLTLLAWDGEFDPVIGRESEIEQVVDILNKRRSNNPLLLGEPGVGKTAIVEGLANAIAHEQDVAAGLHGKIVVELEASAMIGGTGVRGSFAERMKELKEEVYSANGQIVVFMDELHHWIGMGAGADGVADAAGELKTALARGRFPAIAATTWEEYRKFVEKDSAFARRFQSVDVEEPSAEQALDVLRRVAPSYERHHGLTYCDSALQACIRLSERYLPDRRLPDKAIGLLDLAGSRARRLGSTQVDIELVGRVVAENARVPVESVLRTNAERLSTLEDALRRRIVGHRTVLTKVSQILRRNHAGFVSERPIGSFLFLGPTGVGKTEMARAIAAELYEDEKAMTRVDMSEFLEAHSLARLIGAPPGYVGHDEGGQLTEALRRKPHQLVLFDELEKAHPEVLNLLIQILDEGHLTDGQGRKVSFKHALVVMTSNLGAEEVLNMKPERSVGFRATSAETDTNSPVNRCIEAAKGALRPEVWNRIDAPLVFRPLERDQMREVAHMLLAKSSARLRSERSISYTSAPGLVDFLLDNGGYDPELGVRPLRRAVEQRVEVAIAERILAGELEAPCQVEVDANEGKIRVRTWEEIGEAS